MAGINEIIQNLGHNNYNFVFFFKVPGMPVILVCIEPRVILKKSDSGSIHL